MRSSSPATAAILRGEEVDNLEPARTRSSRNTSHVDEHLQRRQEKVQIG